MNAVAVDEVPKVDTFGGLRRETETPEQALRRLERKNNFTKVIGTDEGQRLLAAATAQVKVQPNGGITRRPPASRIQADAQAAADAREGAAPAADGDEVFVGRRPEDELVCIGENHVPGCEHFPAVTAMPAAAPTSTEAILADVALDLVDIGANVRADPGDLQGLADSIVELGLQQPVTVTLTTAGRYTLLLGQRRVLASRLANLPTIRAIVVADPADVLAKPGARRSSEQLAENRVRLAMNPVDEAIALRAILDGEKKLTQVALAKRIGMSEPWVSSTLALLHAPDAVQDLVRADKLSIGHAKALAGLPAADQVRLAKSAADNGVSAHSLEDSAKYERQRLAHIEQRTAAARAKADHAIALLAKVTNVESATVGFADYGGSSGVRELLIEAGWTVVDGWSVTKLDNAGSCGCKGVWRIDNPYGDKDLPKLYPGCKSPSHQERQRTAHNAETEAERARVDAAREAERVAARERGERVVAFLTDTLGSAITLRATLYSLLVEDRSETDLVDRYLTTQEQEADTDDERDFDSLWAAITRVPAEDLPRELALAVASILGSTWDGAEAPLSAIEEAMPDGAPPTEAIVPIEPPVWRALRKSPHGGYTPSHLFPASMEIAWDRRVPGVAACGFDPFVTPAAGGGFDMQIDREGSPLKAVQKQCAKCIVAQAVPAGGHVDLDAIAEAVADA